jgi:maltoporin
MIMLRDALPNVPGGVNLAAPSAVGGAIAFTGLQVAQGACSNNFNWWQLGSRTQYNFTPWFYVGFDVIYQKLESASAGNTVTYNKPGSCVIDANQAGNATYAAAPQVQQLAGGSGRGGFAEEDHRPHVDASEAEDPSVGGQRDTMSGCSVRGTALRTSRL